MTQKEKSSIGWIVLVMAMVAFFALLNPMFRFSLPRVFAHDWLGMNMNGMSLIGWPHGSPDITMILMLLLYLVWICVSIWVYRDAERRNLNGLLWGLFVLIGNFIGLIIYLILRSSSPEWEAGRAAAGSMAAGSTVPGTSPTTAAAVTPSATCPDCSGSIQDYYVACPHCARPLGSQCTACGKRLETDWKACPYCGQGVGEG